MKGVKISQVDALFANGLYPIEFIFYYRDGIDTKRLRSALRDLSSAFWPIFGEFEGGAIVFDRYKEENFFAEEAVNEDLDIPGISTSGFEAFYRFKLPKLRKLFFLKALPLKKGMALIPKMAHLAGDGYSYFYFLSLLALRSRCVPISLKSAWSRFFLRPHHRRTALRDFTFRGAKPEREAEVDSSAVESDEISGPDVRSIIQEAMSSDHARISTNDVLSALAIKKIVAGRTIFPGEKFHLTIPIDVRRRIKEYGRRFLGNGIMFHAVTLTKDAVGTLSAKDIATKIRESMPTVSRESYIRYLTGLEKTIASEKIERLRPFDPDTGVLVTNLSRMPAERLDFGTGRPDLIIPLTTEKNSAGILAKGENYLLMSSG